MGSNSNSNSVTRFNSADYAHGRLSTLHDGYFEECGNKEADKAVLAAIQALA